MTTLPPIGCMGGCDEAQLRCLRATPRPVRRSQSASERRSSTVQRAAATAWTSRVFSASPAATRCYARDDRAHRFAWNDSCDCGCPGPGFRRQRGVGTRVGEGLVRRMPPGRAERAGCVRRRLHRGRKSPATTALSLKVFLQSSHKDMPNLILKPAEADDIIAYILSLKRK